MVYQISKCSLQRSSYKQSIELVTYNACGNPPWTQMYAASGLSNPTPTVSYILVNLPFDTHDLFHVSEGIGLDQANAPQRFT